MKQSSPRLVAIELPPQPESKATDRSLAVLLHAYRHTPGRLATVEQAFRAARPDAHVIVPPLPLTMWSTADLDQVAAGVVKLIDDQIAHRRESRYARFKEIILVGHSTGSMIARKAFVIACGETADVPFVHRERPDEPARIKRRPWASRVTRVIQLAGMNGGWSVSHHMGTRRALEFSLGSAAGHLLLSTTGRRLAIFQIRRGASFLSALRLQWLALQERAAASQRPFPMVVQLLGTVDDLVAPADNLDLVTGREFFYLEVKHSGHVNVIDMDSSPAGKERRKAFCLAVKGSLAQLQARSVAPSDPDAIVGAHSGRFTDVIFVIHGIRDAGFWTHKIARKVQALGRRNERVYATETSTYGYFPMLSFLLPWRRRDKVAWLMDQYVRARALYPGASSFSYLGHSNGTYLLAAALRENPACRFDRVVFAGSVVRQDYDWKQAMRRKQVGAMLNYVATNDKIVAAFPGLLERLPGQDLGSAGHNGFLQARTSAPDSGIHEVKYVAGGHSAALSEEQWEGIASFICHGTVPQPKDPIPPQARSAVFLGRFPWILWALILAALSLITFGIWQIPFEWLRTLTLVGFFWVVVKVLTRF